MSQLDTYRAEWKDIPQTSRWLRRMTVGDSTLAFPQGTQPFGDLGADIDPAVEPDVYADIQNPPFKPRSFDTVYCDPPYSFYGGEQYYFVHPLWELARKRLIFQTNKESVRVSKSEKSIWTMEYENNHPNLIIFQVFDQPNATLDSFQ